MESKKDRRGEKRVKRTKERKVQKEVNVRIMVTANHQGWFYFHLCSRDDPHQGETEECLNRVPLSLADGRARFHLRQRVFGVVNVRVKLPDDVACSHCVLRWKWITGNSWGRDPRTGEGCLGCGPQEQFYGCADINIRPRKPSAPNQSRPVQASFSVLASEVQKASTAGPNDGGRAGVVSNLSNGGIPTRKCLAVNNWEGDPELDRWCDVNCNSNDPGAPRFCPPVFCSCQLI
ncbi:hypothetical protein PoB_004901900 [Plakobranchus ocellatus]|uniref:Chitin-binding type-4 domain-containing protein n=1 Tax=Plakobranchus ocellatus TaxID=259542 RepID=A0AAV4BVS9_9GAST|nr:hypothetical protein PoB_004901900 [Plakobranchus ocellatus]